MNTMTEVKNLATTAGKVRMTPSEAFVETLVAQGVKDTFGIVGSGRTFANKQLDKSALIGVVFPRRGFLARSQPDNDFTITDSLAGL